MKIPKVPENVVNRVVLPLSIGFAVYFFIVRPLLAKGKKGDKLSNEVIRNLPVDERNLTISEKEAKDLANRMFIEMDGLTFYLNIPFWKEAIAKTPTRDDVRLVIKKFGNRKGESLNEWLKNEIHMGTTITGIRAKNHFSI